MSVINHDYRHVFIHVPKVAGTSMERFDFVGGNSHQPAASLVPKASGYWSWGFVRNPYDRLLSAFSSYSQHTAEHSPVRIKETFPEFVWRLPERIKQKGWLFRRVHFHSQSHFLCDKAGKVMVDFVGRYESMGRDWGRVQDKLGVQAELPHRNPSEHKAWPAVYTPETLRVVNTVYEADFEVFGYNRWESMP